MAPVDPPSQDDHVLPRPSRAPELLEAENAQLIEQLDALMDFERRLQELQAERDRELDRVTALNDFALEMAADATAEEVIRRTLELVEARFDLEQILAIRRVEDQVMIYLAKGGGMRVEAEFGLEGWNDCFRWVASLDGPVSVSPWREWEEGGQMERLAPWVDESHRERGTQVIVPIGSRSVDGMGAFLLIDPRRGPSPRFELERLAQEHMPWLALLASHVHRALQVATLTQAVRTRSEELEDKNEQLHTSFADLEQTQQRLLQTGKMEAIGRLAGGWRTTSTICSP
jgi:hypothetical protein